MPHIGQQLDCIFKPESIAIIGASENMSKWGNKMVEWPLQTGYKGAIYPVNPQSTTVFGLRAYPSVKEIPVPVDMAVITIPAREIPRIMQECVEKGVRGAILISAGFAETGQDGKKLEERTIQIARSGGIRCVGPNCMGIWSMAANLNLSFNETPKPGHISFVSQSGTFGIYLTEMAKAQGLGLRAFISIGNEADLTVADYVEYLSNDEETKAIILYIEGVRQGKRFFDVCKEVLRKKPIILYKGGNSPAGARAVMSHTASIAGSEVVFESVCKQLGLICTMEPFDTFEMTMALLGQPLPPGRRIGILGTGGQGVVCVDGCERLGLEVPELDKETSDRLMKMLPSHAPIPKNPVDFAGAFRTASDEVRAVELLLQQDYIDGVISNVPTNPLLWRNRMERLGKPEMVKQIRELTDEGTKRFAGLPLKYGKPIICMRAHSVILKDPVADRLGEAGIPIYDTSGQCCRAMYALVQYAEIKRNKYGS